MNDLAALQRQAQELSPSLTAHEKELVKKVHSFGVNFAESRRFDEDRSLEYSSAEQTNWSR